MNILLPMYFTFSDDSSEESTTPVETSQPQVKSERFLETDEIEADVNVQDVLYQKMSTIIEDSFDFVDVKVKPKKRERTAEAVPCVKLFKDTESIVYLDVVEGEAADWIPPSKHAKVDVKKRIIEPDQYDEDEKIRLAVVDGKQILERSDTNWWKRRRNMDKKHFQYKEVNSVLHLIEEENEFSAMRRKNNWDESKIGKGHTMKWHNKPRNHR